MKPGPDWKRAKMKSKYVADASRIAERIMSEASSGRPFVMFVHKSVDGDCMGSSCGMAQVLRNMGYEADVAMQEDLPGSMEFIGVEDLLFFPDRHGMMPADYTAFAVDCSDGDRMGSCGALFSASGHQIIVDHHITVEITGDSIWIDGGVSSASEMCYYISLKLEEMTGKHLIDPRAAQCFLMGLITDTGKFTYTNTKAETLISAGELMDRGADPSPICYHQYDWKRVEDFKMSAEIRQRVEFYCGGRLAIAKAYLKDYEKYGASREAIDELPSTLRDLDGVWLSVVVRETADRIRVNLRSGDNFNCAEFAKSHKGGGHIRSAGYSVEYSEGLTIDDVTETIIEEVGRLFR